MFSAFTLWQFRLAGHKILFPLCCSEKHVSPFKLASKSAMCFAQLEVATKVMDRVPFEVFASTQILDFADLLK